MEYINVILGYLSKESTYNVVMTMLKAFGVKISQALQDKITALGVAIAELGFTIEELVLVIEDEKNVKQIEAKN